MYKRKRDPATAAGPLTPLIPSSLSGSRQGRVFLLPLLCSPSRSLSSLVDHRPLLALFSSPSSLDRLLPRLLSRPGPVVFLPSPSRRPQPAPGRVLASPPSPRRLPSPKDAREQHPPRLFSSLPSVLFGFSPYPYPFSPPTMADRLPRGHQPDPSGYTSPTSPTGRYHPGGGLAQPQHSYGPSTYDPRGAPTPSSRPPPRAHPTEHVSWSDSPPQGGGQFRGQGQQQRPPVPSKKPSAAGTDSLLPVDPLHYNDGSAAATAGADFRRKKSLVRPERERDDPTARNFHYRQHAAQMEESG